MWTSLSICHARRIFDWGRTKNKVMTFANVALLFCLYCYCFLLSQLLLLLLSFRPSPSQPPLLTAAAAAIVQLSDVGMASNPPFIALPEPPFITQTRTYILHDAPHSLNPGLTRHSVTAGGQSFPRSEGVFSLQSHRVLGGRARKHNGERKGKRKR